LMYRNGNEDAKKLCGELQLQDLCATLEYLN